jgi:ribosome biogenesis GTPase
MHGSRATPVTGERGTGIVLANYGRGVLVQQGAAVLHCMTRSRKQRLVCGDRIGWLRERTGDVPTVESVEPRRNSLERINARGVPEPVAANLDRVAIIAAPEPQPDWYLLDRYWAAARLRDLQALLIVNKSDRPLGALDAELATYRSLGLDCLEVSALAGLGIGALRRRLEHGASLLVGQSGVGKSSLVNVLVPQADAQIAVLTRDAEGRHTTTTARRYTLGPGGALIDAPGVRDFAPPASGARAAERGFIEIEAHAPRCRFNDCRHLEEPGCAVRDALGAQLIAPRRYESYRRLWRLYDGLAER